MKDTDKQLIDVCSAPEDVTKNLEEFESKALEDQEETRNAMARLALLFSPQEES
ncbi:MAG: hypothetical protein ACXQTL_05480 [Methanosarcinales archaeon]